MQAGGCWGQGLPVGVGGEGERKGASLCGCGLEQLAGGGGGRRPLRAEGDAGEGVYGPLTTLMCQCVNIGTNCGTGCGRTSNPDL